MMIESWAHCIAVVAQFASGLPAGRRNAVPAGRVRVGGHRAQARAEHPLFRIFGGRFVGKQEMERLDVFEVVADLLEAGLIIFAI